MKFFVTGGAGFIGSAVIRYLINSTRHSVINIDKLTYAGNLASLESINKSSRYFFEKVDITDSISLDKLFEKYNPDIVMHLAAESHVDRSIDSPSDFIKTNILGSFELLQASRKYLLKNNNKLKNFRFHHISTDEVYGDLGNTNELFTEKTPYSPSSPYSASKASSDHLVRAWARTYQLPIIVTNCSNNYGPYQFPEKLIPLIILNAIEQKDLPVYGNGSQIRDWLYVDDHAKALVHCSLNGINGETYNIGGFNEKRNIDVVKTICKILDKLVPKNNPNIDKYEDLIKFVPDRAGHDIRYAIDASKIKNELGWVPEETFDSGIEKTIKWYIENTEWCQNIQNGNYMRQRQGLLI